MNAGGTAHLLEAELTRSVIGCFYRAYHGLPHGCREHIYSLALEWELTQAGHRVAREKRVMIYYRGRPLALQSLDMVVDDRVVLELKAGERLPPAATSQLFGYLCVTSFEVGLLLHFGPEPKFFRVVCENRLKEPPRGHP